MHRESSKLMATGPLAASHKASLRATRQLMGVFGYLGTKEHPNGKALVAYRNAIRSLNTSLNSNGDGIERTLGLNDALSELRGSLQTTAVEAVSRGHAVGVSSAQSQMEAYQIPLVVDETTAASIEAYAVAAIMAEFGKQEELARSYALSGADPAMIIGDENRQGVLQAAGFIQNAAYWVAQTSSAVIQHAGQASGQAADMVFKKQVVADFSGRTTETCLRANGQVQDLDDKFRLTATPRYADQLDWTPFHWWCRSSIVLYQEEFDFDITNDLQQKSQGELDRRFSLQGHFRPTLGSPTSGLLGKRARRRSRRFSAAQINRRMLAEPTLQARGAIIEAELEIFGSQTAHLKETAVAVNAETGKRILKKTGTRSAVSFTEKEVEKMRNSMITHNHPSGATFSIEDTVFAHENELAEIRAIALDRTYVLQPPMGQNFFAASESAIADVMVEYSDWYSGMADKWEAGIIKQADWVDEGRTFWKDYTERTGTFRYTEIEY